MGQDEFLTHDEDDARSGAHWWFGTVGTCVVVVELVDDTDDLVDDTVDADDVGQLYGSLVAWPVLFQLSPRHRDRSELVLSSVRTSH